MSKEKVLMKTDLHLPLFIRGKVRDTYELGDRLLIVATDRISAFDVVLPEGIPGKGHVLSQLSAFWFEKTAGLLPNHMVAAVDSTDVLAPYLKDAGRYDYLVGRSMLVRKLKRLPVECVVRGYLSGSAWAEYRKSGTVFGNALPPGLAESQELPRPFFTPTTKADTGHDMPLSAAELERLAGKALAEKMTQASFTIYNYARRYAHDRGIIIADTKMEFGLDGEKLTLIDELLTPDSSRFWDAASYKPGQAQPSYDKQPVRDWLISTGWNMEPPAPSLPAEVIAASSERYRTAFERLTGRKLSV